MFANVQKAVTVTDVTDPAKQTVGQAEEGENDYDYPSWGYGLDELGYTVQPGRKYPVRVDPSLAAVDGQKLGYAFTAVVEYWNKSAFVSFGVRSRRLGSTGGPILPFHAAQLQAASSSGSRR